MLRRFHPELWPAPGYKNFRDVRYQWMITVLDLSVRIGVDRLAFSPPLAATTAWIIAKDTVPSDDEIDRIGYSHFSSEIPRGYVNRFTRVRRGTSVLPAADRASSLSLIEEGVLTADSDLRKIIVATEPFGPFPDDASFESRKAYTRGRDLIEGLRAALETLSGYELIRCPRCGVIGELETWFGFRRLAGRRTNQSWCRVCRALER